MLRVLLIVSIALALVGGGCQSWNVDAFGVPVGAAPSYATVSNTPPPPPAKLGHHAKLSMDGMSKDEKTGVIVVLIVAAAAIAGVIIAVNN